MLFTMIRDDCCCVNNAYHALLASYANFPVSCHVFHSVSSCDTPKGDLRMDDSVLSVRACEPPETTANLSESF